MIKPTHFPSELVDLQFECGFHQFSTSVGEIYHHKKEKQL